MNKAKLVSPQGEDFGNIINLQQQILSTTSQAILKGMDAAIRQAIIIIGIDPDDKALIGECVTLVDAEGDPFQHIYLNYGKPDQKLIISIERAIRTEIVPSPDGSFKLIASKRYY